MSGWDVIVRFNRKEDAVTFYSSLINNESVCIPGKFTDSSNSLEVDPHNDLKERSCES